MTTISPEIDQIVDAVRTRRRFVLSSHARPDGDSIGSQLAMAYTLRAMAKEALVVNADPPPPPLMAFPGVRDIRIAPGVEGDFDAAIIMECGDLKRTGIVYVDHEMARVAGGTYEDPEGLVNLPLTVKEIEAVIFFKQEKGDQYRVSLRSKGDVDINAIAKEYGGGGHKNASGCTVTGPIEELQKTLVEKVEGAIDGRPAGR